METKADRAGRRFKNRQKRGQAASSSLTVYYLYTHSHHFSAPGLPGRPVGKCTRAWYTTIQIGVRVQKRRLHAARRT